MKDYSHPVAQLLTLGRPAKPFHLSETKENNQFGFGPEQIPELVRMATDMELNTADSDSAEVWAPLHAWRALAELNPVAAIDAILQILKAVIDETDSDQPGFDLVRLCEQTGAAALPSLERFLSDGTMAHARNYASDAIGRIGRQHPDQRDICVGILVRQLEVFHEQDEGVNGFLICSLLDLHAVEAEPLMQQAIAAGKVDEFLCGNWQEIKIALGLMERPERPYAQALVSDADKIHSPVRPHKPPFVMVAHHGADPALKAKRKAERQAKKKNRKRY